MFCEQQVQSCLKPVVSSTRNNLTQLGMTEERENLRRRARHGKPNLLLCPVIPVVYVSTTRYVETFYFSNIFIAKEKVQAYRQGCKKALLKSWKNETQWSLHLSFTTPWNKNKWPLQTSGVEANPWKSEISATQMHGHKNRENSSAVVRKFN
jgi:hypothetical protein